MLFRSRIVATGRRCTILQKALPDTQTTIQLKYGDKMSTFDFIVSNKQFEYETQSQSNKSITDKQINTLCRDISLLKTSVKDLITSVYNKIVSTFEQFQDKLDIIIKFITLIDVVYTKASIAIKRNYCKPNIVSSIKSFVNAKMLRHCLMETRSEEHTSELQSH